MNMISSPLDSIGRTKGPTLHTARIAEAEPGRLTVDIDGSPVEAHHAVAGPYQPQPDDLVLVIVQDDAVYVIGVLAGRGKTEFVAPGDLTLHAPNGSIDIVAGRDVRLQGESLSFVGRTLDTVVEAVTEEIRTLFRRVRGRFEMRAGEARTVIDQTWRVDAHQILERAEDRLALEGNRVDIA